MTAQIWILCWKRQANWPASYPVQGRDWLQHNPIPLIPGNVASTQMRVLRTALPKSAEQIQAAQSKARVPRVGVRIWPKCQFLAPPPLPGLAPPQALPPSTFPIPSPSQTYLLVLGSTEAKFGLHRSMHVFVPTQPTQNVAQICFTAHLHIQQICNTQRPAQETCASWEYNLDVDVIYKHILFKLRNIQGLVCMHLTYWHSIALLHTQRLLVLTAQTYRGLMLRPWLILLCKPACELLLLKSSIWIFLMMMICKEDFAEKKMRLWIMMWMYYVNVVKLHRLQSQAWQSCKIDPLIMQSTIYQHWKKNFWEHQVEKLLENEQIKILWDFKMPVDWHLEHT